MKRLISFKSILLIVFILFACLTYQACQKDEKVAPKSNESSINTGNASAAVGGCKKNNDPVITGKKYLAISMNNLRRKVMADLNEQGQSECNNSGGSCGIGSSCKFVADSYTMEIAKQSGVEYTINASADGSCKCSE